MAKVADELRERTLTPYRREMAASSVRSRVTCGEARRAAALIDELTDSLSVVLERIDGKGAWTIAEQDKAHSALAKARGEAS